MQQRFTLLIDELLPPFSLIFFSLLHGVGEEVVDAKCRRLILLRDGVVLPNSDRDFDVNVVVDLVVVFNVDLIILVVVKIIIIEAVFRRRDGRVGAARQRRGGALLLPLQPKGRQVLEDPAALESPPLLLKLPENFSFLPTFVASDEFFT